MKVRCKAPEIDSRLRENLCGRKRVCNDFPCVVCDLREEIRKAVGGETPYTESSEYRTLGY